MREILKESGCGHELVDWCVRVVMCVRVFPFNAPHSHLSIALVCKCACVGAIR